MRRKIIFFVFLFVVLAGLFLMLNIQERNSDESLGGIFKSSILQKALGVGESFSTVVETGGLNTDVRGVTQDGTFFWIPDGRDDEVYKYYMNGTYTGDSFDTGYLVSSNGAPEGMTNNGAFIWIADTSDAEVYKYYMNGTYTGDSFDTAGAGAGYIHGITNDGTFFWIVDDEDNLVYKFYMNGTYTGENFDTSVSGNTAAKGIWTNKTFFWITDSTDGEVYKYYMNGTYTGDSFDTDAAGATSPRGIDSDYTHFYVADYDTASVYIFEGPGEQVEEEIFDVENPTYSDVSVDNVFAGQEANFLISVDDDLALETAGYYIFSTNNTGEWVNDSAINFVSTPQTVSVTKTLNETVGNLISYNWYFADNVGNMSSAGERSFIVEEYIPCTDTCESFGYDCGVWNICGEDVACGTCSSGYFCETNGTCIEEICDSHSYLSCYGGDVYWYDSCDEVEEIAEDCNSTQSCVSGVCVEIPETDAIIIDHTTTDLSLIPDYWLEEAKKMTFQYAHRSDGSNILNGLEYLNGVDENLKSSVLIDSLPEQTDPIGIRIMDGNPPLDSYSPATLFWSTPEGRNATLNNWRTGNFNASMWAWCEELDTSNPSLTFVQSYLDTMNQMELEKTGNYSDLDFIYMTSYADSSIPENGVKNQVIRDYAIANGKVLYDFEDIGMYDPDGNYHADADRECSWCAGWCDENPDECVDLPSCSHATAEDGGLLCVQRGKAFWWMMARLAGWDGVPISDTTAPSIEINFPLNQTYNNALMMFNVTATDNYEVDFCSYSLNSGANISMENSFGNYWSSELVLPSGGSFEVTFYCTDDFENVNSVSEVFTFEKNPSVVSLSYIVIPNCSVVEGEGTPVLLVNGEVAPLGTAYDLSEGEYTFNCSLAESPSYEYSEEVSTMTILFEA